MQRHEAILRQPLEENNYNWEIISEQKDISLRNWGHVLTLFFGTCQRIGEGKECQIEDGDGARGRWIGHGLVPIRRLSVYGQVLIRDGLDLEGDIFIY